MICYKSIVIKALFLIIFFPVGCFNIYAKEKVDLITYELLNDSVSFINSDFYNFLTDFGYDPVFQKTRIKFPLLYDSLGIITFIPASEWMHDRLFVDKQAITDISNGKIVDEKSYERVFSWINSINGINKNYYFKFEKGQWSLLKIEVKKDIIVTVKEDFYSFLGRFISDSLFQIQRIKFPLETRGLNDEYEEIEEYITRDKWIYFEFYVKGDSLSTILNNFDCKLIDTDERILFFYGIDNGISAQYTFRRINKKWMMVEYEDFST